RYHAAQRLEVRFDRGQCVCHERWQTSSVDRRLCHDVVVPRDFWEPQCASPDVIFGLDSALRHSTSGLVLLNLLMRSLKTIRCVPQKNDTQYGHEVIARSQLRIGSQIIRSFPKIGFEWSSINEWKERRISEGSFCGKSEQ